MADSNTVRNQAMWEVTNNLPPAPTTNLSAELRSQYEVIRSFEAQAKEAGKK